MKKFSLVLAAAAAVVFAAMAVTARAADDHKLVITFVPTPANIEECGEVLAHGKDRGWYDIFYWKGDYYELLWELNKPLHLECTKLKLVLLEGTERN